MSQVIAVVLIALGMGGLFAGLAGPQAGLAAGGFALVMLAGGFLLDLDGDA